MLVKGTGRGGGAQVQKLFYMALTYIIDGGSATRTTELKNIDLLLRYELSRLGTTHTFSGFCIGKLAELQFQKIHFFQLVSML